MQIQVNIDEREIQKLFKKSEEVSTRLKDLVQVLADKVREFAIQRTPIGEKWVKGVGWSQSGAMRTRWTPVINQGQKWTFFNTAPYANVVEFGKYKGIGKRQPVRTAYGPDGGIYSTQAIGGIVRPIMNSTTGDNQTARAALQQAIAELERMFK